MVWCHLGRWEIYLHWTGMNELGFVSWFDSLNVKWRIELKTNFLVFLIDIAFALVSRFMRWIGFRFEAKRNVFRMIGSRMMWVIGWRAISDWKTISRRCQLLDSPTFQLGEGRPVPILNLIAHRQPDIMFLIYRNLVYQSFFSFLYFRFSIPHGSTFSDYSHQVLLIQLNFWIETNLSFSRCCHVGDWRLLNARFKI